MCWVWGGVIGVGVGGELRSDRGLYLGSTGTLGSEGGEKSGKGEES